MEQSHEGFRSDPTPVSSAAGDAPKSQEEVGVSGPPLEFQSIHKIFRPKILRYLSQLIGEDEAEDLTQGVMVKVSKGLGKFRGDSTLSTWIYRIATNTALEALRSPMAKWTARQHRSAEIQSVGAAYFVERDIACDEQAPSVQETLIRKEMNECIREFMDRLPEPYKTVLVLSELEGLKDSEIAEILCISLPYGQDSLAPRPR
jgi:RNA polymerase sigma-70 factor (ECF subfamily)